jgi:cobalt-zinc-cadmium efflux system membrane fusion protein
VIYLDSFASNAPVPGAKVEVEGAGLKGVAVEVAPGVYQLPAPALGAGKHALTVSIETADNADLLATTLDVAPRVLTARPQAHRPG